MPHLGLAVTLTQSVVLPVANATQGHLAENIYDVGVANATQGHTVAVPGQTQLHILPAVAADQGHTAIPVVLVKNLPAASASMGHEATPNTLAKVVLAANATHGHTATPIPIGLTVVNATMGHEGLAVSFGGAAANLTVVAGTMPHDGFGVEQFSPTQLPDLQLWLAPDPGAFTVTAGVITQWNDKSGLANHARNVGTSATMPHMASGATNGFNAARFNAAGRRLWAETLAAVCAVASSSRSSMSIAVVIQSSSDAQTSRIVCAGGTSAAAANVRALALINGRHRIVEIDGAAAVTAVAYGSSKLTPEVVRWTLVNGSANAWNNGAAVLSDTRVSAGGSFTLGVSGQIAIGAAGDGTNAFLGHVNEVIISSTVWSSSQGRELDKLLGAKYGITIT
jgi:hypothetical protein